MAGRMQFEFGLPKKASQPRKLDEDAPMRILLIGDFTAREARARKEASDLAGRGLPRVDVDTFDDVLARLAPSLPWSGAGEEGLAFRSMEDFHPDHLYATLPVFARLRDLRKRLNDPQTAHEAAAALRDVVVQQSANADEQAAPAEDDGDTLERLLGKKPEADAAGGAAPKGFVQRLLADAVAPHIVPEAPPNHELYVQAVNDSLSTQMSEVLHHGAFQELESLWRGVQWLVTELGGNESIHIHLLDVTRRELTDDLRAAEGDLDRSALHRLVVDEQSRTHGSAPWSALVAGFAFGPDEDDLTLLAGLGAIAAAAGGPLLAEGRAAFVGTDSLAAHPHQSEWAIDPDAAERIAALRQTPVAKWIGLALPRVLLRVPYGPGTDEIDSFPFVELPADAAHESYLWGSPAVAIALLLGRAYDDASWEMSPGDVLDLSDLPSHIYTDDGEKKLKPCAEVLLNERAMTQVLEAGLMPLASYADRNAVRVPRLQSVAHPASALAGPWG